MTIYEYPLVICAKVPSLSSMANTKSCSLWLTLCVVLYLERSYRGADDFPPPSSFGAEHRKHTHTKTSSLSNISSTHVRKENVGMRMIFMCGGFWACGVCGVWRCSTRKIDYFYWAAFKGVNKIYYFRKSYLLFPPKFMFIATAFLLYICICIHHTIHPNDTSKSIAVELGCEKHRILSFYGVCRIQPPNRSCNE